MKILVCLTKAPDTTARVAFTDNNTRYDESGVQWIVNPYDEWYALVRAIELKEKDPSTVIHLITVGQADCDPVIRKALALGGDEAIRINCTPADPFAVAGELAKVASEGGYDLVLTGKETIDFNGSVVSGLLAAMLGWTHVALATKVEIADGKATVAREIEGGEETVEAALPLLISCQKGVAEQRIPNMRGIMAARTKPLAVREPSGAEALTEPVSFEARPPRAGVKMVAPDQMDELVRLLHEEAKAI